MASVHGQCSLAADETMAARDIHQDRQRAQPAGRKNMQRGGNLVRDLVNAEVCLAGKSMLGIVRLALLRADGKCLVSCFAQS